MDKGSRRRNSTTQLPENHSEPNLSNYKVNSIPSYDYSTNLVKYYREKIWNNNDKYIASSLTSSVSNPEEYCVWTPANVDDCEVRTKWVYYYNNDLQTVTDIYLVKYRWNNVSSTSGATYYSSGSMNFRIANWSGTMTFRGATTPSTYTASNGSMTITGTLTPATSARSFGGGDTSEWNSSVDGYHVGLY